MLLCVYEDERVAHLLPLVYTRAAYDLRLGHRTLFETIRDGLDRPRTVLHARPLVAAAAGQEHGLPVNRIPEGVGVLFVNGRWIAEEGDVLERLRAASGGGEPGRVFVQGDEVVAAWVPDAAGRHVEANALTRATFDGLTEETIEGARFVGRLWHLLDELHGALVRDYRSRVRKNVYERPGADVAAGALLVGGEDIFVAPGAVVRPGALLSAADGPIYIGEEAVVMEGALVRGPMYVGPHVQVKPGTIAEACAIGPWSKIGGEVKDTVFVSYANKVHAGHLGDAYLGRWCNIGAGSDNSNLKNDYGEVSLYNTALGTYEDSGRQFLGLFMGDHSKCGIGSTFNTGTVVGVFCNLYGAGFLPRHVPSFSWGGPDGLVEYRLSKALRVAETVMARRDVPFTETDRDLLSAVFDASYGTRG